MFYHDYFQLSSYSNTTDMNKWIAIIHLAFNKMMANTVLQRAVVNILRLVNEVSVQVQLTHAKSF